MTVGRGVRHTGGSYGLHPRLNYTAAAGSRPQAVKGVGRTGWTYGRMLEVGAARTSCRGIHVSLEIEASRSSGGQLSSSAEFPCAAHKAERTSLRPTYAHARTIPLYPFPSICVRAHLLCMSVCRMLHVFFVSDSCSCVSVRSHKGLDMRHALPARCLSCVRNDFVFLAHVLR
eukprot:6105396-Prymnesium_polylepis.1